MKFEFDKYPIPSNLKVYSLPTEANNGQIGRIEYTGVGIVAYGPSYTATFSFGTFSSDRDITILSSVNNINPDFNGNISIGLQSVLDNGFTASISNLGISAIDGIELDSSEGNLNLSFVKILINNIPVYSGNTYAIAAGLPDNTLYRTDDGTLKLVYPESP